MKETSWEHTSDDGSGKARVVVDEDLTSGRYKIVLEVSPKADATEAQATADWARVWSALACGLADVLDDIEGKTS